MRRLTLMVLASVIVLAGCAGSDSSGDTGETALAYGDTAGGSVGAPAEGGDEAMRELTLDVGFTDNRQVIRHARLELNAGDTRSAYEDIVAMVEAIGGFVADAQVSPTSGEDQQPQVSLTLRVPADQLDGVMKAIKSSVDKVVSESQGAEDVTDQFVDLQARLTNLKALEVELRALLEEVRKQENADPEKLLTVFRELSNTRGQIEQIEGQLKYLDDKVTMATLDVQLTQTPAAVPIVDEPWSPAEVAREAVRNLVAGLQTAADWVIGFALYALPLLVLAGVPILIVGVVVYRRYFRKEQPAQS